MPRAVREGGVLLVFAGFGSLGTAPHVETGLSGDDIEAAAWAEVRAIWQLLTVPPAALRNFARAVVSTAPDDLLQDAGLPLDRDLAKVLKRLPQEARARQEPLRDTAFARTKIRYMATRGM